MFKKVNLRLLLIKVKFGMVDDGPMLAVGVKIYYLGYRTFLYEKPDIFKYLVKKYLIFIKNVIPFWKRLLAGTVPANKNLFARTSSGK